MKFERTWMTSLVVAVVSLTSGGWLLQQGAGSGGRVYESARLFEEVHRLVSDRYVDEIGASELYQMAIEGMLRELGDPYTSFLDRDDWEDLRLSTTGNYGGLGIRIQERDGWITVVAVLPNTPAEKEGLLTGDRIIEVEGETTEGWNGDKAVQVLRGPKGSTVEIGVARIGFDTPLRFAITRDEIHVVSVEAFMLEDGIGYVQLRNFPRDSRRELRRAMDDLIEAGASSLVLDLRSNPGGLLEEGIAVSDLFLARGEEVVATKSRLADQNHVYLSPGKEFYEGLPLVVLVNEWSASASEIVAGALQDHDRALVVGTTSFGKGSVQTLYSLSGGNHIKITTAKWYTPSGRSIQKESDRQRAMTDLMADAVTVSGEPVAVREHTEAKEVFSTDDGRVVYGGGGITPDLVIPQDTLTAREQELGRAVARGGVTLGNAAFRFGVKWANEHPEIPEDFAVTPAMRSAFYEYLLDQGGEADRELFDASLSWVDWLLGREIANAAFGETSRQQRSLVRDLQIEEALRWLRQAKSPEELLSLATAEASRERVAPDGTSP